MKTGKKLMNYLRGFGYLSIAIITGWSAFSANAIILKILLIIAAIATLLLGIDSIVGNINTEKRIQELENRHAYVDDNGVLHLP